jgi:hypothetical protein
MKDTLISINPKFKKLNNPILRRTLAKLATVKQAAIIGGMEPAELLNKLRVSVGQEPLNMQNYNIKTQKAPKWIDDKPLKILDANELLDKGENPLAKLNSILKSANNQDIVIVKSDFRPQPLIDEFEKKGFEVYCLEKSPQEYLTYFKK